MGTTHVQSLWFAASACALLTQAAARAAPSQDERSCEKLGSRALDGSLQRGQEAPDFELTDVAGKTWSLRAMRGRPVLLSFWATWCEPCKKEIPALERLAGRPGERLVVLTVSVDEKPEAIRSFFPKGTSLPVLLDPRKQVAKRYGTAKFPETFLIDSAGRVRHLFYQADWGQPSASECLNAIR